jgi:hypothetical protein
VVTDFSAIVTETTTKQELIKIFLAFLTSPAVVEPTGIEAVKP